MKETNTSFDSYHSLDTKTPIYLVAFDGESTDYVNHSPLSPVNSIKAYLSSIRGGNQRITPEEGRSSISGVNFSLLDVDDGITALLATDPYQFHRKPTTIKAGYHGMTEANMIDLFVGWITSINLSKDALNWEFSVTDPQRWLQRKIFRDATAASPIVVGGNPINLLLQILMTTEDGSGGYWDSYHVTKFPGGNGLGIDEDYIDVSGIEKVRDTWFHGVMFDFSIVEPIQAKKFIETEILKVLNIYPTTTGDGRFTIKPFKPLLAAVDVTQTFDEDLIVGIPAFSLNFGELINELEMSYDWEVVETGKFDQTIFYIDSTSLNNRGPGKQSLKIESKGMLTNRDGLRLATMRKNRVFQRYATPPLKLTCKCLFTAWLTEIGDIVPVTHTLLPDVEAGTRGLSSVKMEVVNRSIDWRTGKVSFELLDTGFAKNIYAAIQPSTRVGLHHINFEDEITAGTFFEVVEDPQITVDQWELRAVNLDRNDETYIYRDCGAAFFGDDFEFYFEAELQTANAAARLCVWGLSNDIAGFAAWGEHLRLDILETGGNYRFQLREEQTDTTATTDTMTGTLSLNTKYYLTIRRDESIGAYGTLFCWIYTDSSRNTLFKTLSITLNEANNFQFFYPMAGQDQVTGGYSISAWVRNYSHPHKIRGEELTPNGTAVSDWGYEANSFGAWAAMASAPDTFELYTGHRNDYSFHVVNISGGLRGFHLKNITIKNGRTYQVSYDYYIASGVGLRVGIRDNKRSQNHNLRTNTTLTTWTSITDTFTATWSDQSAALRFYSNNGNCEFIIDNVSLIEVTKLQIDWKGRVRGRNNQIYSSFSVIEDITDGIMTLNNEIWNIPRQGSFFDFVPYDGAIAAQQLYGYISDGTSWIDAADEETNAGTLGTASDDHHKIAA